MARETPEELKALADSLAKDISAGHGRKATARLTDEELIEVARRSPPRIEFERTRWDRVVLPVVITELTYRLEFSNRMVEAQPPEPNAEVSDGE